MKKFFKKLGIEIGKCTVAMIFIIGAGSFVAVLACVAVPLDWAYKFTRWIGFVK